MNCHTGTGYTVHSQETLNAEASNTNMLFKHVLITF